MLFLKSLAVAVNNKVPKEASITIVTTSESRKADLMKIWYNERFDFLTMDNLASVETDVVILNLSGMGMQWIDNSPITALTRARLSLIIVGTMSTFEVVSTKQKIPYCGRLVDERSVLHFRF